MATPAYTAERFALDSAPRVDRDKGVVYGVRVVGPKSRNGRVYPAAVLKTAAPMFEGVPVYVGHHFDPATMTPREPPPEAKFGRIVNARFDRDGITADLRYNPKLAFAEGFLWACENDPAFYQFSQLARVAYQPANDADGNRVAAEYRQVASVDIVSEGGATHTIFDSDQSKGGRTVADDTETQSTDPKAVAGEMDSPGKVVAFLTDFFGALKGMDQAAKEQILAAVTPFLTAAQAEPTAPDDAAIGDPAAAAAMESLRRYGPFGRWAARKLDAYFTAESLNRRRQWADSLMTAESLPAHLRTAVFTEMVAESFGNEARAKALIADRRQLGGPGGGAGPAPGGSKFSPAGGGAKSVKDLVAEMSIG